nr:reverse transcriptase domain-containing protein [Tanacetum cinerariifolium]
MANTTPLVTTVTKPTNNPGEANIAPRVNIQELCEEYYEDILPIIIEKARHEQLKDVQTRLDFGEGPRERIRENSHYSNTRAKNAEPERKGQGSWKPQDQSKKHADKRPDFRAHQAGHVSSRRGRTTAKVEHYDGISKLLKRRPLSERAREGQVPDSRNGLLHKVDRSKGGGNDYRRTDNGKQFTDNPFKDWCDKLNITQRFASVKHPQSNGLVERANRSLGEGIKARLGEGNKNWVEELPHVLWAHRTIIKSSHGDTPFSITYGTEAVIHAEIGMPTYRTTAVDVVNNDEELRLNLDLLEERRVRGVAFKPGDFVYRSNDASHAIAGGKLGPKWEGPYEVTDALGNGAYKMWSTDGTMLPRTWNVTNLKRCYL